MRLRPALLFIVGILVFAAWFLHAQAPPDPARPDPSTTVDVRARSDVTARTSPDQVAGAAAKAFGPLPPVDAPLSGFADALEERADAGDSAAACRLGAELARCRALLQFASPEGIFLHGQVRIAELEALGETEEAGRLRPWADAEAAAALECAKLPEPLRRRGPELLRQAALAGEPEAMLRYAEGLGMFGATTGFLRDPVFDHWRREALPTLQRALASGMPEAALLLAAGHGGGEGMVEALIPDDAVDAEAARQLAVRLLGEEVTVAWLGSRQYMPTPAPEDERAQAAANAERMHAAFFAAHDPGARDLLVLRPQAYYGGHAEPLPPPRIGTGCGTLE
ncbi:hypothetical protein [Arenimonas composti]|uniref:Uncharacterized protein n=1 Tax=Arenimonas composti TR7-09 = DSM 18010 TaxID=1121013 RepID=A0A091BDM0_9GAMM|nr:hypothetical protein [Arenimonas composti]KFN50793.1 hypothetical protein P873_05050 [Arenimonas composti TR7-09 = DSM 18010]